MDASTRKSLNDINRQFYAEHATAFAETRAHPWPGWERAWAHVSPADPLRVLDVGCGSGRFATFLTHQNGPDSIHYIGMDASAPLLERARNTAANLGSEDFRAADWVEDPPDTCLPKGPFEVAVLLGVLHHVPGHVERRALIAALVERLVVGGVLALTAWRFAAPEIRDRFEDRMVPFKDWQARNNAELDLEPGDYLLRWGNGPEVVRYCHFTDETEMAELMRGLPVEIADDFREDGRSGDLNHYLVLRRI